MAISDRNLVEHVPIELIAPKIKVSGLELIGGDNNDDVVLQRKESGSE